MAYNTRKSRSAFLAASVPCENNDKKDRVDSQADEAPPSEKCPFCWGMLDANVDPEMRCTGGPPIQLACCKKAYGLECFEEAISSPQTNICPCCRRRMWMGDVRERFRDAWLEVTGPRWALFLSWRYVTAAMALSLSFVNFRASIDRSDAVEDGLSHLMSELPIARLQSSGILIISLGLAMTTFHYYLSLLNLYAQLADGWYVMPVDPLPAGDQHVNGTAHAEMSVKTVLKVIGKGVLMVGEVVLTVVRQEWHRLGHMGKAAVFMMASLQVIALLFPDSPGTNFLAEILTAMAFWKILLIKIEWHGLQPLHFRCLWIIVPIATYFAQYRLWPLEFQTGLHDYSYVFASRGPSPALLVFVSTLYDVGKAYKRIAKQA
ncbi:hypothetical protein BLS_008042 [Venturia inaequalis]|uniref:Uncharacterized protein n=1 Tax=Venturia inaequalis TaxID=5025 RepID=A0A8H3YL94_VENIN|nr:hypothetical protein BLS_008042 [Venturia inaequalis]KAE9987435.1 hypothetical protein EG328_002791 [Venturia inaequalis]KAE9994344.1 hypothetical protein EG327_011446 [Venturia inaequalis]RDI86821.1 hypothetical protein Vi05172_g3217 [Venturia inaequalis]